MSAHPKLKYTLEEYLELDRNSEERLEFWDGEVFSMSGASRQHDRITGDFVTFLNLKLMERGCEAFTPDMRIKVPSLPPYRYGDVSALCGEAKFEEFDGVDMLVNPMLIVEVLSKSTEGKDRGDKFSHYKSIPSFCEYLLVAQHRPYVTQYIKKGDGFWLQREYNSLDEVVKIECLDCELAMRDIYRRVKFEEPSGLGEII
ncbi:MAG: Uma2 family endonuclease [Acidobacteria bacterium]|nr:Uma2 family endonuclease [Acidobacteriota bacterium]